jgi:hypothetical protein
MISVAPERGMSKDCLMHIRRALPIVAILFLMGCSTSLHEDHGVPLIVLADTAPARLEVVIEITEGGYDATAASTTDIAIQFISHGRLVAFRNDETIACNRSPAIPIGTGFDGRYATTDIVGTHFTCIYTSGQNQATIQFLVPLAPTILSPTQGAMVKRSSATPIHFQGGSPDATIAAFATQNKAIAQIVASGMASVDTSRFTAGPGSITLTQFLTSAQAAAPAFATFHVTCTAIAHQDVVWA